MKVIWIASIVGAMWIGAPKAQACTPGSWEYATVNASGSGGSCSINASRMCGSAGYWLPWGGGSCSYTRYFTGSATCCLSGSDYTCSVSCTSTVSCSGSPSGASCYEGGAWCASPIRTGC